MTLDLHFEIQLPDFTLKADCTLPGQGFTAILGPSGCGKTTLAGSITGLKTPKRGRIAVNGQIFNAVSRADFDAANALCLILSLFAVLLFLATEVLMRRALKS